MSESTVNALITGVFAFLGLLGGGGIFAFILARRAQPSQIASTEAGTIEIYQKALADAVDQARAAALANVDLQKSVTDALTAATKFGLNQTDIIYQQTMRSAEQTHTNNLLVEANNGLISKLDGLPKMVAEQAAIIVLKDVFAVALQDALKLAGVKIADQPVSPVIQPLTPLVPPSLLVDLANEQRAAHKDDPPSSSSLTPGVPPN